MANKQRSDEGVCQLREVESWYVIGLCRELISVDSGSTNNPVLRFLLFVPATKHRPMRLAVPGESFLLFCHRQILS